MKERTQPGRGLPGAALALALFLALGLPGCAGRHGSIRWDAAAGREFESATVLPGHRYFAAASEVKPEALLALRADRPLRSDLWHEIPADSPTLRRLVDRMRQGRVEGPWGRAVIDDTGARIGAWYSLYDPPPLRVLEDGGIVVDPPVTTGPMHGPFRERR